MDALKIENLHKAFEGRAVIDGLSLSIPQKTIFGFLGKNGAGKTTTMNMILGFLDVDGGSIEVFGERVTYGQTKTNRLIGYLPDVPEFYGYMNAREYLELCGSVTGLTKKKREEKCSELLELVGLDGVDKKIKNYSRGMKQRLGIAQALLNSPKLLICDEPTSALDPVGRHDILEIIHKVKETTTVIFSTHILSDVEAVCDHVVVLDRGKNVLEGSIDELKRIKKAGDVAIRFQSNEDLEKFKETEIASDADIRREGDRLYLSRRSLEGTDLLYALYQSDIFPLELCIKEPTLEDIFMEVIDT